MEPVRESSGKKRRPGYITREVTATPILQEPPATEDEVNVAPSPSKRRAPSAPEPSTSVSCDYYCEQDEEELPGIMPVLRLPLTCHDLAVPDEIFFSSERKVNPNDLNRDVLFSILSACIDMDLSEGAISRFVRMFRVCKRFHLILDTEVMWKKFVSHLCTMWATDESPKLFRWQPMEILCSNRVVAGGLSLALATPHEVGRVESQMAAEEDYSCILDLTRLPQQEYPPFMEWRRILHEPEHVARFSDPRTIPLAKAAICLAYALLKPPKTTVEVMRLVLCMKDIPHNNLKMPGMDRCITLNHNFPTYSIINTAGDYDRWFRYCKLDPSALLLKLQQNIDYTRQLELYIDVILTHESTTHFIRDAHQAVELTKSSVADHQRSVMEKELGTSTYHSTLSLLKQIGTNNFKYQSRVYSFGSRARLACTMLTELGLIDDIEQVSWYHPSSEDLELGCGSYDCFRQTAQTWCSRTGLKKGCQSCARLFGQTQVMRSSKIFTTDQTRRLLLQQMSPDSMGIGNIPLGLPSRSGREIHAEILTRGYSLILWPEKQSLLDMILVFTERYLIKHDPFILWTLAKLAQTCVKIKQVIYEAPVWRLLLGQAIAPGPSEPLAARLLGQIGIDAKSFVGWNLESSSHIPWNITHDLDQLEQHGKRYYWNPSDISYAPSSVIQGTEATWRDVFIIFVLLHYVVPHDRLFSFLVVAKLWNPPLWSETLLNKLFDRSGHPSLLPFNDNITLGELTRLCYRDRNYTLVARMQLRCQYQMLQTISYYFSKNRPQYF